MAARCTLAGFFVQGRRVRLEANRALANYRHGILVSGLASQTGFPEDTVLQANIANENAAFGIAVLFAERTNVTGNTGLRNRTDFCDQGTGTVATGNTFGVVASNACLN